MFNKMKLNGIKGKAVNVRVAERKSGGLDNSPSTKGSPVEKRLSRVGYSLHIEIVSSSWCDPLTSHLYNRRKDY